MKTLNLVKNTKLLTVLLIGLLCGTTQAKERILKIPERNQMTTQTACIGGYLFAVIKFRAAYADGGGSVSISQIFKAGGLPIECDA